MECIIERAWDHALEFERVADLDSLRFERRLQPWQQQKPQQEQRPQGKRKQKQAQQQLQQPLPPQQPPLPQQQPPPRPPCGDDYAWVQSILATKVTDG